MGNLWILLLQLLDEVIVINLHSFFIVCGFLGRREARNGQKGTFYIHFVIFTKRLHVNEAQSGSFGSEFK